MKQKEREILMERRVRRAREILKAREGRGDEALEPLLRQLIETLGDPGVELAYLSAFDLEKTVRNIAYTVLYMVTEHRYLPEEIRQCILKSAGPLLFRVLHDKEVPDERKHLFGLLLERCGFQLSEEEYRSCFRNFEATSKAKFAEMSEKMFSDDPKVVEGFLEMAQLIHRQGSAKLTDKDFHGAFALATAVHQHNKSAGTVLIGTTLALALEHRKLPEECRIVLKGLSAMGGEQVAWLLNEIAHWPALGSFREQAKREVEEMRSRGIQPHVRSPGEFSHAIVSNVDGAGSRSLALFWRTRQGEMDTLCLLLNDQVGFKEMWCVFEEGAGLEEEMREKKGERVTWAPCSLEFARELVGHTLTIHEEKNIRVPGIFMLYRPMLGEYPIEIRCRKPNLDYYMLEMPAPGPNLEKGSEKLCRDPIYGNLWTGLDEAYKFIQVATKGRSGWKFLSGEDFKRYVRQVWPSQQELLLTRMACNLEVEALAGRAREPMNRLAIRTWLVLKENLVPLEKIGYIQGLCRKEVSAVQANLRMGYRSQKEANEDRLRMDEENITVEEEMNWTDLDMQRRIA